MPDHVSLAEAISLGLAQHGIAHVFGFPGETSLPLYTALQRHPVPRHVLARCPRCAAYMAEGYARTSGAIGVCDAPGGIGSPFAAPALLEARNSSTPMLFLASGPPQKKRGRWVTGECDQQALFAPVTKSSSRIEVAGRINAELRECLRLAGSARTGPVFLEIPGDLFDHPVEPPGEVVANPDHPRVRTTPSPDLVRQAAAEIRLARAPVILAGGGVHLGGAVPALRALVDGTGVPVATTLNGKGAVDESALIALGVAGAKGCRSTNRRIDEADVLIVIGSKLGDKSSNSYAWPRPGQLLVNVNDDPRELHRGARQEIAVLGDAGLFCDALHKELRRDGYTYGGPAAAKPAPFWDEGLTATLCDRLTGTLRDDDVLVADASVASGWAGAAVRLHGPRQRLLTPRGTGSLGYALPAALGAQIARPAARVVAIGGDGGLAMAMHELETAVRYRLPIVYFLLNNQRLGLIDRHAVDLLGGEPISAGFSAMDWQAIAGGFGWRSHQVSSAGELENVWPDLFGTPTGPVLVECVTPVDEIAPDLFLTLRKAGSAHG